MDTEIRRLTQIPIPLFLLSLITSLSLIPLAYLCGFSMEIPWNLWQLLDSNELKERMTMSLWLLHSQPPLLNVFLGMVLKLAFLFHCNPEIIAGTCFVIIGFFILFLLAHLCFDITQSKRLSCLAILMIVLDPAYLLYQHMFFNTFPLQVLLLLFVACGHLYLMSRRRRYLFGAAIALVLCANLSTLFSVPFALVSFVVLIFWRFRASDVLPRQERKAVAISILILTAGLTLWPLKNALVFGQYTFSSWTGYNLIVRTFLHDAELDGFMNQGTVPDATRQELLRFGNQYGAENITTIAAVWKSSGGRNLNHLYLADSNRRLCREALDWRMKHLDSWRDISLAHYPMWSRAAFIEPYNNSILGPENVGYRLYAGNYGRWLFHDLRPFMTQHMPFVLTAFDTEPVQACSLFGFLWFPLIMLAVPCLLAVERGRRDLSAPAILLCWITMVWCCLVPCLTAGVEGNRMRFSAMPLFVTMVVFVLDRLVHHVRQVWKGRTVCGSRWEIGR